MSENIVGDWLRSLRLSQYTEGFLDNGYDDLEICKQIGEPDLDAIGVSNPVHRNELLRAVRTLREHGGTAVYFTVEETLAAAAAAAAQAAQAAQAAAQAAAVAEQCSSEQCAAGLPNYSTYMYDDELPLKASAPAESPVSGGGAGGDGLVEPALFFRKYVDEYEEGKAELVKIPRLQLKGLIRDKLTRDGLHLSSPPYSNADGSKGYLDGVAVKYADEFKTHYQDVVEHLETLRRKEVEVAMSSQVKLAPAVEAIYAHASPSSVHSSPLYKPGKYLPSSCLSDQEEEEIYGYGGYGVYARRIYKHHANRLACLATPQRCLNPTKTQGFYDSCHFSSSTSDIKDSPSTACDNPESLVQTKKPRGGPLGRILRGLALHRKEKSPSNSKEKGTRHHLTPTKSLPPRIPDPALYSDSTYASREVRAAAEERMKLVLMVKDGQISMEQAFEKMCQYEPERRWVTQDEVLKDFRHGFLNVGTSKKPELKETARFYTTVDSSYIHGPQKPHHWYDDPPYESDQDEMCNQQKTAISIPAYVEQGAIKFANGSCLREAAPHASWVYSGDNVIMTRTAGDIQVTRDQIRLKKSGGKCGSPGMRLSNASTNSSSKRDSLDSPREDGGGNSPTHERRNKMFSKFKSITGRGPTPNSASEEALSLSSDYEEQENDECNKKMDRRLSRDVAGRASAFVGRVKGFGNDVRKKISKLRPSRTVSESEASETNANVEATVATSASSVESLPSGSGSSVQALTTSSSNRSSTSVEEEAPTYTGPFIGKAKALVDYTPSPYDKDALKFKKGDTIDIISMSQTGSWTGVMNNRVGHFKFINVEIIPEPKPRPRRSHLPRRRNSKRGKPKSVEELLHRINLEEHISVFVLNGYENLDLFKELEEEDLDYLGISIPEHRAKILTAVELLHDYDSPETPEGGDGDAASTEDGELCGDPLDPSKLVGDADGFAQQKVAQSPRDSGCYASNENLPQQRYSSSATGHSTDSANASLPNDLDSGATNSGCSLSSYGHRGSNNNNNNSNNNGNAISGGNRECCSVVNHVTKAIIETVPKPHSFEPNIFPGASNSMLVEFEGTSSSATGEPVELRRSEVRGGGLKGVVVPGCNSRSAIVSQEVPASVASAVIGGLEPRSSTLPRNGRNATDGRIKKLKDSLEMRGKANPNVAPVSLATLEATLKGKLEGEMIDFTQEPYTDKTGFCGIPPALVQRYADEAKRDVSEVATELDRIRLSHLQQRGKQGVPNDFLADACACPLYDTCYSSVRSWLTSVGLPMYADQLASAGCLQLSDVVRMEERDLCACGIDNPSHLRRLVVEIAALNVHLQKFAS